MSRQKIMLGLLGTLAVLQGGDWLLTNVVNGPLQQRRAKRSQLEKKIKQRQSELAETRKEGKLLAIWESQSLPSDSEVARSLYQSWLLGLVENAGLANPHVDSGAAVNRKGLYRSLTFTVRVRGSLAQLTQFLFEFYSANHLHQIQTLVITPLKKSGELDLSMTIGALILPTADRTDELATGKSDRLASATFAKYAPVVRRNLWGVGSGTDPADHAFLTAIISSDGQPEAWFTLRDADKVLKLRNGQKLAVGQVTGRIVQIVGSDIVIESGGERWLLSIGESLNNAFSLPPEF